MYAWIIDTDHLADENYPEGTMSNAKGVTGPRQAPKELIEALKAGKGLQFKMYDDDSELYYTGRGIADKDGQESEEFCYGPLGDFGAPNAGAVLIKWTNHPEWNCG
jgi:hypothetical protein